MNENMLLKDFIETIKFELNAKMGSDYDIQATTTAKNNGLYLEGLCIKRKEDTVAPVIYMAPYYKDYREGRLILDIVENIILTFKDWDTKKPVVHSLNWEQIKDKITVRLVNYELNKELLETVPYKEVFGDLVVTFHIVVESGSDGIKTIRIGNELFNSFPVSIDSLYEIALSNTAKLFPAVVRDMEDIIVDMLDKDTGLSEEYQQFEGAMFLLHNRTQMIVVSNRTGVYGATAILYPNMLKSIAEQTKSDLYILPSSLHEMILVPVKDKEMAAIDLNNMVYEVNQTEVEDDDILSNNAYVYRAGANRVEMLI